DRGVPYLAMALLRGETLEQRLQRDPRLAVVEVLRVGREMATGLVAAHAKGLVHRDIKPSNVWLEESRGRVKLLDFGLARAVEEDARLTSTGMVPGTPSYMAPEQAAGEAVDHRSDLFSLGGVLYRMCTGELPFKGKTALQVLRSLALDEPTPPYVYNPEVPQVLSDLILSLLSKDREGRPSSAGEVVKALADIERDPTIAEPDAAGAL